MAVRLTPTFLAELAAYNSGIRRARHANATQAETDCPSGICSPEVACGRCRRRAAADLLVATSVAECAELIALLDKPSPRRGRTATVRHGTESAYRRHLRHGEPACQPCLAATNEAAKRRKS